jgi:hypothetical protein
MKPVHPVDKQYINELCEELLPLLEAELAAGNSIVETWKGWPYKDSLYIMLANPFKVPPETLPRNVRFVAVDDPHYWKSELVCDRTHHALACGFGR